MADMVAAAMERGRVASRFGKLSAADSELNGDYLKALPRLYLLTGDARYLAWGRRIADAYIEAGLPGNFGLPRMVLWDFASHSGDRKLKLRDHGNEMVVGLVTQFALEHQLGTARAAKMRPVLARMFDRVWASGNALKNARKDPKLGSFDGYADAIESAIYLVNRELMGLLKTGTGRGTSTGRRCCGR